MARVSQTLRVLMEIRDAVRRTNERVDRLTGRVDALGENVSTLTEHVGTLQKSIVIEMSGNREAIQELAATFRERRDKHGVRLDDHERRLRALERRTG